MKSAAIKRDLLVALGVGAGVCAGFPMTICCEDAKYSVKTLAVGFAGGESPFSNQY